MKKTLLGLLLLIAFCQQNIQALEPAESDLLEEAATQITTLFERKFKVKMASPELGKLLSEQVAIASQQMGMPVNIRISYFNISNADGKQDCQVVLSNETPMREMLEPQANSLLQSSGISNMLCQATLVSLQKAGKMLLEKKDSFKVSRDSDSNCDYLSEDLQIPFAATTVQKVSLRIDKASKSITNFVLEMQDQTTLRVNLKMGTPKDAPDGQVCPRAIRIEQNLQDTTAKGIKVPKTINAKFAGYEFLE